MPRHKLVLLPALSHVHLGIFAYRVFCLLASAVLKEDSASSDRSVQVGNGQQHSLKTVKQLSYLFHVTFVR